MNEQRHPLSELERRVLDAIDAVWLLSRISDLIEQRSLSGHESAAQGKVAERLRRLGMEVDEWAIDLDEVRRHPAYSEEVVRAEAVGVVGALGDGDGPTLIFNGHIDVVPPGDEALWSCSPWRATVSGGRLCGRGAADMKGGLGCALAAVKALQDAGARLRGRLLVQSVVGEEDGGVGTLAAILRGHTGDGAVVMEPTSLAVLPVQAGALSFRVTVPGLAAHGCVRDEGVSAIEKFHVVHSALLELERRRNDAVGHPLLAGPRLPIPLSIGRVRAGEWASSVPESLVCEGRYGVAPGEELATARADFEAAVAAAAQADPWLREHPPLVDWFGGQFEPAEVPADHPLIATLNGAYGASGAGAALPGGAGGDPVRIGAATYGSDARLLTNHGATPAVLFGPGDVRASHRPDESVAVTELVAAARVLALTALRFCGAE